MRSRSRETPIGRRGRRCRGLERSGAGGRARQTLTWGPGMEDSSDPMGEPRAEITGIEIVEDFTATGRCDEGFLQVRRLRCRNRRADGSSSSVYRVDVIDRPRLDAVAVLIHRATPRGVEVLTRQNLRPAAYFRKDKDPAVPDGRVHLAV